MLKDWFIYIKVDKLFIYINVLCVERLEVDKLFIYINVLCVERLEVDKLFIYIKRIVC